MTTRPYTTDDLRAEAARQHATATRDLDFMGIGEQMNREPIPSTVVDLEQDTGVPVEMSRTWDQLDGDDFEAAQRAVDELLNEAADTSGWAINLGADGLEPSDEHAITVNGNGTPIARIHFAFEPGMPEETRAGLVEGIGNAIAGAL